MGSNKVVIAEINQKNEEYQTPIILNFQNGKLNSENKEKKEFACAYDSEIQKDTAILAVNGNIYHGLIECNDQLDTYIAIRNKRTKTVRLIQVDQAILSHDVYSRKDTTPRIKLDQQLAVKQLIKNFGSRKAGIYLERNERMKVNVDSVKNQLEKTIDDYDSNNENDEKNKTIDSGVENIVPPFNNLATNINDIYKINEIISQNLLDRLNEEANEVLTTTEKLPIPSEYILNQIMDIKNSPSKNSPENLTKIKVYLYMDALSALIKTRNRNLSKTTLSHITEKIENHIRLNFSPKDSTKAIKTSFTSDKATCYFITLAILMTPNFEIDVNIFTQELSRPRRKILQYANFVHAKLKPRTDIVTLQLPKPIKPMSMNGKRKRL